MRQEVFRASITEIESRQFAELIFDSSRSGARLDGVPLFLVVAALLALRGAPMIRTTRLNLLGRGIGLRHFVAGFLAPDYDQQEQVRCSVTDGAFPEFAETGRFPLIHESGEQVVCPWRYTRQARTPAATRDSILGQ